MLKIEMMSMKLEDNDADETNGDDVGPEESRVGWGMEPPLRHNGRSYS